ncbi:uncharacterized protein LOC135397085 [Ornithodoros turicata]|uniref:uncharacterized protein LOC135397085 n=1 Tax=Ornithodoros turicata TaxID=34597 RepID=UPI003139D108
MWRGALLYVYSIALLCMMLEESHEQDEEGDVVVYALEAVYDPQTGTCTTVVFNYVIPEYPIHYKTYPNGTCNTVRCNGSMSAVEFLRHATCDPNPVDPDPNHRCVLSYTVDHPVTTRCCETEAKCDVPYCTEARTLHVQKKPARVCVKDKTGQVVCKQANS